MRVLLISAGLALLVLIASGFFYSAMSSLRDKRLFPPPGRLVDVGSHRLHVFCAGRGAPTVVLESGAGGTVLDWSLVSARLAETTTVCAYDRAGLGWSEPGQRPRTTGAMVSELRSLLSAAELPPPYVLVGHSFGGLVALQFAGNHPEDVAGMVLVDSVHPALNERMPSGFAEGTKGRLWSLSLGGFLAPTGIPRLLFPPLAPKGLPPEYEAPARVLGYRSQTYRTVREEAENFDTSAAQLKFRSLSKELPMVVLSRGRSEQWPPSVSADDAEEVWRELQMELASLSANSTQIVARSSGHYIQIEAPETVVAAVLDLVAELRRVAAL